MFYATLLILSKLIEREFAADEGMKNSFLEMKHELFELYKFMMFYEKGSLDENVLEVIGTDFSKVEHDMFKLYNTFHEVLTEVIESLREGNLDGRGLEASITALFRNLEVKPTVDTYLNRAKSEIDEVIAGVDKVFMDGFLFFDDLQKYVIASAVRQGKKVNLVAKYSISDQTNSFLFEDNYYALSRELGHEISPPNVDEEEYTGNTALNYVKMRYPDIEMRISTDIKDKIRDGSITIVKPFPNRDRELWFIANSISRILRESGAQDEAGLLNVLKNDIAVVLAVEKEKYEERLSDILKDIGVFVYRGDTQLNNTGLERPVDKNSFGRIYYSKAELLDAKIRYEDGSSLSYKDKYTLFKKAFKGLGIRKTPRPIASYPIGQFILQIYDMVTGGMTIEGFKMILYSNWYYNIQKDTEKWDKHISSFKNIEVYFEDKKDINSWIAEVEKIMALKQEIEGDGLYKGHPFRHIDIESLAFLRKILNDLAIIMESIKAVRGSIEEHIEALREKVMDADRILSMDHPELEFEQKIIKKFNEAVEQIGSNSVVDNLDTIYFSRNLRGMLTDWENERLDDDPDSLQVNVVNLENMKKYKYSFFMMLEADKYPRKYRDEFPFAKEVLSIMEDEKYGIRRKPADRHGLEYHLRLEQYLFKNVLDFTRERLVITYTEKEDKNINKPSIYVEDITSLFDKNITEVEGPDAMGNESGGDTGFDPDRIPEMKLTGRESFTLVDLALFKLCPRLYFQLKYNNQYEHIAYASRFQLCFYAEAILYCELFNRFKEYNEVSNKMYSAHDDEYVSVLNELLEDCCEEVFKYFDFLREYEKKDIKNKVMDKAVNFVYGNAIEYGHLNSFSIVNEEANARQCANGCNLLLEQDVKIVGGRYPLTYQNNTYLDFLVKKTGNRDSNVRSINQIIDFLGTNGEDIDRVNLAYRLIHNMNLNLSNSYSRANAEATTAVDRLINEIESTDFMQTKMMDSKFCSYCKMNEVCKGSQHMSREDANEL